uniref:Uncharacterized protein n=1 Tax=viral metagenome TaxID=1070528 RepID=A0A6H2A5Q0_9ZZZZ
MSNETFGDWCPYKDNLFCQEREDCEDCAVYYDTMPLPYDGRTLGEIDRAEYWAELTLEKEIEERRLTKI